LSALGATKQTCGGAILRAPSGARCPCPPPPPPPPMPRFASPPVPYKARVSCPLPCRLSRTRCAALALLSCPLVPEPRYGSAKEGECGKSVRRVWCCMACAGLLVSGGVAGGEQGAAMQGEAKTVLDECDLRGVELGKAKLNGVSLLGANLSGANLICADLENALLCSAILRYMCCRPESPSVALKAPVALPLPCLPGSTCLSSAFPCLSTLVCSDARMMEVNARGADMQKSFLHRVNLDDACLVDAKVLGSSWKEVLDRPALRAFLPSSHHCTARGTSAHLLPAGFLLLPTPCCGAESCHSINETRRVVTRLTSGPPALRCNFALCHRRRATCAGCRCARPT